MSSFATFSPDGKYRYALARNLGFYGEGRVLFIMLNPSTADAIQDDPTIRRCRDYAKQWDFGRMYVGNLSPLRATDPQDLKRAGPEPRSICMKNLKAIRDMARLSQLVVCAWGVHGGLESRDNLVNYTLSRAGISTLCLGTTNGGYPRHPLYLAKDTELEAYLRPEV